MVRAGLALDADVDGGGVEVAAGVAVDVAEAGHDLDLLALEVILDARQLVVEARVHGAHFLGPLAAEDVVEGGERLLVVAAVVVVEVDA
jgi:hypothetical protein